MTLGPWSRVCKCKLGGAGEVKFNSQDYWLFGPVGRAGTRWYVVIGYFSRSAGRLRSDVFHLIRECSSSAALSASRHKQRPEITSPGELRDFLSLIGREVGFF